MRFQLCLLLLCNPGGFTVSVEPARPVFTVTVEQTEKPKAAAEPEMIFLTASWCKAPCGQVKADIKAGKYKGVKVVECDIDTGKPPIKTDSVPAFWWKSPDGRAWQYPPPNTPPNQAGYIGAESMMAMWKATQQPGYSAPKATSELDGLSPQLRALYDHYRGLGYSHEQIKAYAKRRGWIQ